MSDKEIIIRSVSSHLSSIAKILFPRMPEQAFNTLIQMGISNKLNNSKIKQFTEFLFDSEDNLPSPNDFWEIFKSVLNEKPFSFDIFNQKIIINGNDVDEVRKIFNNNKIQNN